jgi:CRP-like cAMP-binding protein
MISTIVKLGSRSYSGIRDVKPVPASKEVWQQAKWTAQALENVLAGHEPRKTTIARAPGALIVRKGDLADRFYIITKGAVDVFLPHPSGQEIFVDRLEEGQYFGEVGLLRAGRRTASVRAAAGEPVEVVTLDREDFERLIAESAATRADLDRAVVERSRPDPVAEVA